MTGAAENGATLLESKKKLISKTYLRNAWYVAAWSDDLVDGQLLARTIMKQPVVLYRKADGHVAAILDRCSHGSRLCTWERSSTAIASSVPITGSNSMRPAPAC